MLLNALLIVFYAFTYLLRSKVDFVRQVLCWKVSCRESCSTRVDSTWGRRQMAGQLCDIGIGTKHNAVSMGRELAQSVYLPQCQKQFVGFH
jgi:hypothetical protein